MEMKSLLAQKRCTILVQTFMLLTLGAHSVSGSEGLESTPKSPLTPIVKGQLSKAEQAKLAREFLRQASVEKKKRSAEEAALAKSADEVTARKRQEVAERIKSHPLTARDIKEMYQTLLEEESEILAKAFVSDAEIKAALLEGNIDGLAEKAAALAKQVDAYNSVKAIDAKEHEATPLVSALNNLVVKIANEETHLAQKIGSAVKQLPEGDAIRKELEGKFAKMREEQAKFRANGKKLDGHIKARADLEADKPEDVTTTFAMPSPHKRSLSDDARLWAEAQKRRPTQRALFQPSQTEKLAEQLEDLRRELAAAQVVKPVAGDTKLLKDYEDLKREVEALKKTNTAANSTSTDKTKSLLSHLKQLWIPASILCTAVATILAMNYYKSKQPAKAAKTA